MRSMAIVSFFFCAQGKRVLVVDDVITAGTAIREAFGILRGEGATPTGVVIALDRQVKRKKKKIQEGPNR